MHTSWRSIHKIFFPVVYDVIIMWLGGLNKYLYFQLWIMGKLQSSNLDYMYIFWKSVPRVLPPGFSDVIFIWSLDLDKFQYFHLWRGYNRRIRTVNSSFGDKSVGYSSSVARDVIIMWRNSLEKFSSLHLWMNYSHQF